MSWNILIAISSAFGVQVLAAIIWLIRLEGKINMNGEKIRSERERHLDCKSIQSELLKKIDREFAEFRSDIGELKTSTAELSTIFEAYMEKK